MKKFAKVLLTVVAVVALSGAISYVAMNRYSEKMMEAFDRQCAETRGDDGLKGNIFPVRESLPAAAPVDFVEAAEKSVHAVVHIMSKTTPTNSGYGSQGPIDLFEYFFGSRDITPRQQQPQVGYGSGVIISSDGYIVTNNHVIDGADEIEVTLNDGRTSPAKVIGADPTTDVALIKIEESGLSTIPFGDSDELKVGEWVLAVGNPLNLTSTVTAGIVSAKARNLGMNDNRSQQKLSIESFIQTDAAVNPGNSGGALVNTKGELVGINTAILSTSGAFSGYSFAIPTSIVRKVVSDLKEFGTVQRAMLGVTIQAMTSELAKEKKIDMVEGVYVAGVSDRSGAMEAGIEKGDIIVKIQSKKVTSVAALQEEVSKYRPGDEVNLEFIREGKKQEVKVRLLNMQGTTAVVKTAGMEVLGGAFGELSVQTRRQLNIGYGIQVTGLTDGKLKEAGVRKGFIIMKVNDKRISSVADFEKIVQNVQNEGGFGEKALFLVGMYPTGKVCYYAVNLDEAEE